MVSESAEEERAWAKALLTDEGALRQAFRDKPEAAKKLLRNEGFLYALFDPKSGAFSALLAAKLADDEAALDNLLGRYGDGANGTPRQAKVAARLERWLDQRDAGQAFRQEPELVMALVNNPAFVEQVKVLKPEFYQALLSKGKERFKQDAEMWTAIQKAERGLSSFTAQADFQNEEIDQEKDLGERLLQAAKAGDVNSTRRLLDRGADPNLQDISAWTALMEAANDGHADVVRLLLEKGANPNLQDKHDRTALMLAGGNGHADVVRLLLEKGANPNLQDKHDRTALMGAAWGRHADVVRRLLDRGADPNLQDKHARTALMGAVDAGHGGVVRLLLEKGANPNFRSKQGRTALDLAMELGNQAVAELLRAAMRHKGPDTKGSLER